MVSKVVRTIIAFFMLIIGLIVFIFFFNFYFMPMNPIPFT
jgi:hypothetical protein